MKLIWQLFFLNLSLFLITQNSYSQTHKVIESGSQHLIVEFNLAKSYSVIDTTIEGKTYQKIRGEDYSYRNPGDPWLPEFKIVAGIPLNSKPTIKILEQKQSVLKNKFVIPYPEEDPDIVKQDFNKINQEAYSKNEYFPYAAAMLDVSYIVRYAKVLPIIITPYQFNPVTRDLVFNSKVTVRVDFNVQNNLNIINQSDAMTNEFLEMSVVNPNVAKGFTGKIISEDSPLSQIDYWYNPNKNYFKVYVKEKNVYRLTYEELISSGVQLGSSTPTNKLELFNDGLPVPIEVFDNNSDLIFNEGDYLIFVGFPPSVTQYCTMNIYNLSNIYWFSYQSDSSGVRYQNIPVGISYDRTYFSNLTTLHLEKDSLYERLGYAGNDRRDFWFWDKASSRNQQPNYIFNQYFETFPGWFLPDSPYVRLKVAMQGMSTTTFCTKDHKADIKINDREVGSISWEGQDNTVFNKRFYASVDSIPIYPGNQLKVEVRGDVCTAIDDEIRINWIEFEYWRGNSAFGKYYNFKNYDLSGINRYGIFDWEGNDVHIYIPTKNRMMYLPDTGSYREFVDTMTTVTEYFLASSDYYTSVDSIVADIPSDLRSISNGCDYIIITHNKFKDIANQLASFRQVDFPDENIPNPRICVVDVQQIYDEFSFGLLEPEALREFVKYAFENWATPAPSYVVLLGDMSYDYRGLIQTNRPNFIPSIPYYSQPEYGLAASDNLIVAVSGLDVAPDLAIGRLSIETIEEGNILLQKLIDYPDDASKPWQQNVLLLASGLSLQDELQFGFNDESFSLGNIYVVPQGYETSYVFRYPSKPEHEPYQGEGPKIREEINKGAVLVNYYGHGGGYQWDLVFTNDDIYLLENGGRLPVILSVTCYTAHFDNQDVFGEQFNKVPGKGSIGFYGSSGLTFWGVGKAINRALFSDIFNSRNFIVGKAIMNSKNIVPNAGLYGTQINLLSYLGDPVMKLALPEYPDFEIESNSISLNPENPLLGDTIQVKINISNWGTVFPNDSVVVELFASLADTSYEIGQTKRPNFPEKDSVYFSWVPDKGGLYTLTAKVNETDIIMEEDHSDNIGTALFIIFNISEPNILTPFDGFVSTSNQIEFNFTDIGYYIPKALEYFIEIDTSTSFMSPLLSSSGRLIPDKSSVRWTSPNLTEDVYFWRARIFDGTDYGNWSPVRTFSIVNEQKDGYYAHEEILKTFTSYNVNYVEESKSLVLNTEPLPARPSSRTFEKSFLPVPQIPDSVNLTTMTTDGTYLYCANIRFYAQELTDGKSMIYRYGTGENGTVEGQYYGTFSAFRDTILHNIAYHNGFIYVAIGEPYKIVRINVSTEIIDTVDVPPGLIRDIATVNKGPQYLSSDDQYIYNLAYVDSLINPKYTVRIFDPSNGWSLVRPQFELFGTSFYPGFTDFFVHGERIYTAEQFNNYIRRHRLSDGIFEEEFLATDPPQSNFQHYYAWCWDWQNDKIYASVFKYADTTVVPKFGKFAGYYVDANGTITTKSVGPVAWWNKLKYDFINPSPSGEYSVILLGQNSVTKIWDTLRVNLPDSLSLIGINADTYSYLRLKFDLIDSTFQTTEPMELRNVQIDYQSLNDIYVEREDFNFQQDSLLQGYPITFDFKARNFGNISADSLSLSFFLNGLDSLIYKPVVSVPADSFSNPTEYTLDTRNLLFENKVTAYGENNKREYFYFNNLIDGKFFVARDSTRPIFDVTFDGQEIINNDIVSSTPEVIITLEDNSPLPLDTSYFTIVHNNKPLRFYQPEINWSYEGVGSPFIITWTPNLPDENNKLTPPERNTLEVLAKDASGNFFDSTSYRVTFNVYTENNITDVYNYPNPFSSNTYFTFILQGEDKPSELEIKIFTIAGRLIRDIKLSSADLITNFNKIYWDGKDEDGDEVGNGVYLYKVIATFPDQTKTITQKLARVR